MKGCVGVCPRKDYDRASKKIDANKLIFTELQPNKILFGALF